MKPFDLKQALEGKRVVTRGGRAEIKGLHLFENGILAGVSSAVPKRLYTWDKTGKYLESSPFDGSCDLFMAPEKKSGWISIWEDKGLTYNRCSQICKTEMDARTQLYGYDGNIVAVVKVEWEE